VLRIGKSAVHVEGRILDGDHVLCTALAVFGRARESMLVIAPPRPVVPLDADRSKQMPWAGDAPPKFTQHVEQRWASGAFPFCGGAEPRTQIYVRYRNELEVDESLVIAMADTIPSPAISMLHSFAPASSLSWTLELLTDRWPRNGGDWWLVDAEATAARDGYAFQTATMWSADGQPIALSRQSAVVFG
jgi:acyl-CoA thioesterase